MSAWLRSEVASLSLSPFNWLSRGFGVMGMSALYWRHYVTLTADGLREIESACSCLTVQGARLPEAALSMTGR